MSERDESIIKAFKEVASHRRRPFTMKKLLALLRQFKNCCRYWKHPQSELFAKICDQL